MAVKLLHVGNPRAGTYDLNDGDKKAGYGAAKEDGDDAAPAGVRLEGRGMPTGPMFFNKRRFTGTSEADDDDTHLLKTTAHKGMGADPQR